jgi:hypothetical protein
MHPASSWSTKSSPNDIPGDIAVGKRVRTDSEGPYLEIIGVVRTAKYRNLRKRRFRSFIPLGQAMRGDMTLVVHQC